MFGGKTADWPLVQSDTFFPAYLRKPFAAGVSHWYQAGDGVARTAVSVRCIANAAIQCVRITVLCGAMNSKRAYFVESESLCLDLKSLITPLGT